MSLYDERLKWFHEARFGMVIHFGLYSLLGRGEWAMFAERTPAEEYAELAWKFNPKKLDADAWMSLAKDSGMKYAVFTTRHHDGFCLYDSAVSDFTSVKSPAKRDFVAEYVEAARRAGLRVGLYYSWLDWRFPGYFDHKAHPESARAVVRQAHDQLRELMTNYGRIDYLWYDGHWVPGIEPKHWPEFWGAAEINRMVRELQPDIIINNRSGLKGDVDTPEQHVSASEPGRAWESCMTMGDHCGWGYIANNPNLKPATQLIQHLVTAAAGEGNYLLNIGPKPDGTVRREEKARLRAIGEWMSANGESIYGSERCSFGRPFWPGGIDGMVGMLGLATRKGSTAYIHIFRWPAQGEACIPELKNEVVRATILGTGQEVGVTRGSNHRMFIRDLPKNPPDPHCTVVKLELDGPPEAYLTAVDQLPVMF